MLIYRAWILLMLNLLLGCNASKSEKVQVPPANKAPEAEPGGKRLLFIGNSYTSTNDLPGLVQELAKQAGRPRPFVERFLRGGSLQDQYQTHGIEKIIAPGPWDYVILQQGPSSVPENAEDLKRSVLEAEPVIRQAGATPALYMVWPEKTRLQAFSAVRKSYYQAAKEAKGIFLPAGLAWQKALNQDPELPLFVIDKLHPTEEGTYLAAMAIVAKLFDADPNKMPLKVTWSTHYSAVLTTDRHRLYVEAVRAALDFQHEPITK